MANIFDILKPLFKGEVDVKFGRTITWLTLIWLLCRMGLSSALAAPVQNSATGTLNGVSLNLSNAAVNLVTASTSTSSAVTSASAEIMPNSVIMSSTTNTFVYTLLPVLNASDTGINQIAITTPNGYANISISSVLIGGSALIQACPTPAAGQYCGATAGRIITVTLGSKVTVSLTRINIQFTADAPNIDGTGDFTSTVDDTTTPSIPPQAAAAGDADGNASNGNGITVTIKPKVDAGKSTVTVDPQIVIADGMATSAIRVTLIDSKDQPAPGKTVTVGSDRVLGIDTILQPASNTDAQGIAAGTISSTTPGVSTITATDITDNVVISMKPAVYFTQGNVLELVKTANRREATVGDVVTYLVELKNKTAKDVVLVKVDDHIPPNFKYLKGSTIINGVKVVDPAGNRTLTFDVGTVPALVDANGNNVADKGEAGYVTISYQLVIGSGATPKEYENTAAAKDVCDSCAISNSDKAKVTVMLDPLFELGTIIGKVFEDKNKNGRQDKDEPGIPSVMVALDDGTYALTDEYGRYHLPAIKPGQRLVKINLQGLPNGAGTTTDEARIVSVTPGLLAKVNFGVVYNYDVEKIGKPAVTGINVNSTENKKPVELMGNTEALTLLINGEGIPLLSNEVQIKVEGLDEIVTTKGQKLEKDIEFLSETSDPEWVEAWKLNIIDSSDKIVKTLQGIGAVPPSIPWNGLMDDGRTLHGGKIYQYQMEIQYEDGTASTSTRRIFGVNNVSVFSVRLSNSAFDEDSDVLNEKTKDTLRQAAIVFRTYPEEKIIIGGHTDSRGDKETRTLYQERAQAVADFLIQDEKLAADRITVRWYGKTKPITSNKTPAGREYNRRIEIKGDFQEVENSELRDNYRTEPSVSMNGEVLRVDSMGRFTATILDAKTEQLDLAMVNSNGRSAKTSLHVPSIEVIEPKGEILLPFGESGKGYRVNAPSERENILVYRLSGRIEPGNTLELDGEPLSTATDGAFTTDLITKVGSNSYGLLVSNEEGVSRLTSLIIEIKDRTKTGKPIIVSKPIPNLMVKLPAAGIKLTSQELAISGMTDPGNDIEVNGRQVKTDGEGRFSTILKLPLGKSGIVVKAIDPEKNVGTIERGVEVTDNKIFLLAFADGKFGQLTTKGNLQEAGTDKQKEFYTEGRLAYYLKGVISGKYLITSAFDTGARKFGEMFKNLDTGENDRLLTNLDPDKLYPVYGDSSTVVYDVQSQGKLYLAIDSDELHVLVGNYALSINDVELAAYQRTLYGSRIAYQSVSRTKYGRPDTTVMVFGAEVRQAHIQDELRATGGSLYYLSHKDIIEGSEQVSILVRDKTTGLTLEKISQKENIDYTIKYEEGRVLFNRPIQSVVAGGSLITAGVTPGNPVYIQVDYESQLAAFEKKADGARVRKQLGDHVAVGATYVKDELLEAQYELKGVDSEIRLGKNTRLTTEYAESDGVSSRMFRSDDGGLGYQEVAPLGPKHGHAWKATAEVDAGEWFNKPDRFFLGGYIKKLEPGFLSNGNTLDEGAEKIGVNAKLKITDADTFLYRLDSERLSASLTSSATSTAGLRNVDTTTIQVAHKGVRWSAEGEYQARESDSLSGLADKSSSAAGRLAYQVTDKLSTGVERQQTLAGLKNDQTTVGLEYQVLPSLTLKASGTEAVSGNSAQGGAVYSFDGNRVYIAERLADDQAGKSATSTILGGETPIGPASKVYTEYQWERADGAMRNVSLLGALRNWDLGNGLKLMLAGEQSEILSNSDKTKRSSLAMGLAYSSKTGLKVSTRNELRREHGTNETTQYLTVNNLEYKLNPDLTFIGKYRYSLSRDLKNNIIAAGFDEYSAGFAYRPIAHDWFNALAKYTSLSQRNASLLDPTQEVMTKSDVFSVEWSAELSRYVEWVEKEAAKIRTERLEDRDRTTTHTYLSIHRLNFHIWKPIDLGIEYRMLRQVEARDQREGFLAELAWHMVKHLSLGMGYNFTNFSDNEFTENNYSVRGWFVRLQSKF